MRKREKESQADATLWAEPHAGLNLMALRSLPKLKSRVSRLYDCTTHLPQVEYTIKYQNVNEKVATGF